MGRQDLGVVDQRDLDTGGPLNWSWDPRTIDFAERPEQSTALTLGFEIGRARIAGWERTAVKRPHGDLEFREVPYERH